MKRVTSLPSFSNTADSSGGGVGKVRPRRGWLGSIMKTVDEEEAYAPPDTSKSRSPPISPSSSTTALAPSPSSSTSTLTTSASIQIPSSPSFPSSPSSSSSSSSDTNQSNDFFLADLCESVPLVTQLNDTAHARDSLLLESGTPPRMSIFDRTMSLPVFSPPPPPRTLKFTTVTLRHYPCVLSDNPSVSSTGPPIGLDWCYHEFPAITLDRYELEYHGRTLLTGGGGLRNGRMYKACRIGPRKRREICEIGGGTKREISKVERECEKVRQARRKSLSRFEKDVRRHNEMEREKERMESLGTANPSDFGPPPASSNKERKGLGGRKKSWQSLFGGGK